MYLAYVFWTPLTVSNQVPNGKPPSLENDHSCLLAVATSLMSADIKQRMIGTVKSTAAVLLPVELLKTIRKGVWRGLERTASWSPMQKIMVMTVEKARIPLKTKDAMREKGTVLEASRAFSATLGISRRSREGSMTRTHSCARNCRIHKVR